MTFPSGGPSRPIPHPATPAAEPPGAVSPADASDSPARRELGPIAWLEPDDADPGAVVLTCANCGAAMDERKCKLICRCGYFLSCSDYY
jgi:hypothetical protein